MKMFPKTKFVKENNQPQQILHIKSELSEASKEFLEGNDKNLKLELIDVKHSVDTLLHMLGVDEEENMRLSNEVIKKNFDRGYYKEG